MIPLLPKWNLHDNRPSFYDADAVTMLELAAKLHGSMNNLINDYNKFVENTNKAITDFTNGTNEDLEVFETAMRQEFQDFIDAVYLEYSTQEQRIREVADECVSQIEGSIDRVLNDEY